MVCTLEALLLCGIWVLLSQKNTNCAEWPDGLRSTHTRATWDLGSLILEKLIAPSGRMVCTLEALLLRGTGVLLSTQHKLRRVAGRSTHYSSSATWHLASLSHKTSIARAHPPSASPTPQPWPAE